VGSGLLASMKEIVVGFAAWLWLMGWMTLQTAQHP